MSAPAGRVVSGALPGEIERRRLANGMQVCLVRNPQAPIVSTALFYRVGGRDELPGESGTAHFLEHMMFKGSARYGPGEVDRRTQALGGSNNAFTSHDVTAYWFSFAADRWTEALAIEADRMLGLRLDEGEVESERRVILEEIDMYRDDPWDALEMEVLAALFLDHPYGRPVLGTPEALRSTGAEELRGFHRRFYRPDNAVLVVAGDLDDSAAGAVEAAFGGLAPGATPRPAIAASRRPQHELRVERRHGEVTRLFLALPAPAGDEPDHAELRLAATLLSEGRASRLQRTLVEEGQLCLGVSASVAEQQIGSFFALAAELLPDADPSEVEQRIRQGLASLLDEVNEREFERARHIFLADWVSALERIHQQAVATGMAVTLFDLGYPDRLVERVRSMTPADVAAAADRWLRLDRGSVTGLSLPEGKRRRRK